MIILGKHFLYISALDSSRYHFQDFVYLRNEKVSLEKYLATAKSKENKFVKKWISFLSFRLRTVRDSPIVIP